MSKNQVLLSVITVVAIVAMASETATAQIFKGRLLGRRSQANNCCTPAPAPAPCCAATPAPAPAPAPCCGAAAPAPAPAAPCCGGGVAVSTAAPTVVSAPTPAAPMVTSAPMVQAPVMTAAPMVSAPVSSCCGGGVVGGSVMSGQIVDYGTAMPMQGTIVSGGESYAMEGVVSSETILESGETVQASPSDSTVTSSAVVEPPAAVESTETAPEEEN